MKKILIVLTLVLASVSLHAGKYNYSLSPYLGYHYFGDDRNKEDNVELGLKVERFLQDNLGFEVGLGYIPTEKDGSKNDINLFSYQTHLKYYIGNYSGLEPYVSGGVGGDINHGMNIGPSLALGAKYNIKDNLGLFAEARDNYLFGDGNDVIITAGMNFYIGEKSQPVMDSDGDGVNDNMDNCPDTPQGVKVSSDGCPYDSDNDGIYDYLDKCPNTSENASVDSKGCPLDTDNDGVYDYMDKCPNTPENSSVDSKGCSLDTDNDGVYDYLDKCPHSPADSKVDNKGCEISIELQVYFDTDKTVVKEKFYDEIRKVANFMKKYPEINIEIAGHTDNRGDKQYNINLSQKRASAVANVLINEYGISKDRVKAKGYGPEKPVASNGTAKGRQKNRRVEAVILR